MITVTNYSDSVNSIDINKMPKAIQEGHKYMTKYAEFYNDDADIKKAIDNHVKLLNEALSKKKDDAFVKEHIIIAKPPKHDFVEPKKEIKPKAESKPKKEKAPKHRKPKYKEGDRLSFRDNDDSVINEKIVETGFKSDGEPVYTVTGSRSNPSWKYAESEIDDSIKRKVMYLNQPAPKDVHHLEPEVRFIKRYALLHDKVKTRDELLSFLHTLQKALNDKTITKKSPFAIEIIDIQNGLVKLVNSCGTNDSVKVEIDAENLDKYQKIATGQKVIYSIPIIKQFIMLSGKPQVKAKAEKLLNRIQESIKKGIFKSDPHSDAIKNIKSAIEEFIAGKQERLILADISLRGLYGIAGIEPPAVVLTPGRVISSSEFVHASFTLIGFDGDWKKLIGTPQEPFKIMIYGKPGCGKSSLALKLAHYLTSKHNQKVLAVCKEEGFNYTVKEKLTRLNIAHPNLMVTDQLPSDLTPYNTILTDSVNSLKISPDDLQELYLKYPKKNWIEVFQTTKDGNFRGEQDYSHDVDTVIRCEDMVAYPEKNRFGGKEAVRVV